MMKYLYSFLLICICGSGFAQVGINVTGTPIAELEIIGSDGDVPALQLTPQSAPTGTATGQMAVINNQLFMYDATRSKWLSVEGEMMMFGENSPLQGAYTRFGGDLRADGNGAVMPLDGTIVYATGRMASGDTDKVITIAVRNGTSDVATQTISFTPGPGATDAQFNETNFNLDFSAGDYLTAFIPDDGTGNEIEEHTILLWVKWRP